jgi:SnoaL-like domain
MSTTQLHPEPTETELTETERRLRGLVDRSEIADLVARSLVAIDEARFDDLRTIYAEDSSASAPGGQARGRDAIIAQVNRNHTPEHRSQHLVGDVVVDLDGDTAQVRANVFAAFAPSAPDDASPLAPPAQVTFGTVYRYRAVRTPDGWRLSDVEITPLWVSGSTEGLLRPASTETAPPTPTLADRSDA